MMSLVARASFDLRLSDETTQESETRNRRHVPLRISGSPLAFVIENQREQLVLSVVRLLSSIHFASEV